MIKMGNKLLMSYVRKLIVMFRLVLIKMCSVMRLPSESCVSHVTHVMI